MTSNNQYYHDYNRFVSYQDLPDDVIAQMQEEEDADAVALSEHNARRAQDNEQSSINGESSSNEEELSNGSISSSSVLSELNLDRVVEEVFNDEVSDINLFTMGQFYDSVCRRMSVRALTNQMKEQIRQLLRTLLPPPDNDQSDNNSNNNDDAQDQEEQQDSSSSSSSSSSDSTGSYSSRSFSSDVSHISGDSLVLDAHDGIIQSDEETESESDASASDLSNVTNRDTDDISQLPSGSSQEQSFESEESGDSNSSADYSIGSD